VTVALWPAVIAPGDTATVVTSRIVTLTADQVTESP
jgi:hypothetical protein